uniref:CCHC-type domain-containing protein n=1 Tax=Macaca mulatta TaxID=9544 RepID=A0A5F7ZNC0_MACMU
MGTTQSKPNQKSPLGCLLANLQTLSLSQDIKRKRLIFFCTIAWPQYKLDNQSQWPAEGTLDFNILTDLTNFCKRLGKWSKIPYVQAFWDLRSHPDHCAQCSLAQVLLAKSLPLSKEKDDSSPFSEPPDTLSRPPLRSPAQHPPYPDPPLSPSSSTPPHPSPHPVPLPNPTDSVSPTSTSSPSSPVSAHTQSRTDLCPLQEVAGAKGVVRVHVPFSLADLSKVDERAGSFSANPTGYIKEFRYLCQAYDLSWHDLHVVMTSTLSPEEQERILVAARQHANQVHLTDPAMPVGTEAVPSAEPDWDYQVGQAGRRRRDMMVQCLLAGMQAASNKSVNFNKLKEVVQGADENPAVFLNRLTEALIQYTCLDPASPAGRTVLASYFISQSAPDIQKKLKKAEDGPQTPIQDLVKLAFKVYNSREEAAEAQQQARLKQKVQLQTQALVAALRPAGSRSSQKGGTTRAPPGACFKCGSDGHWARQCPNPKEPTHPCLNCQQMGHWKSDCPDLRTVAVPPRDDPPPCIGGAFQLLDIDED